MFLSDLPVIFVCPMDSLIETEIFLKSTLNELTSCMARLQVCGHYDKLPSIKKLAKHGVTKKLQGQKVPPEQRARCLN